MRKFISLLSAAAMVAALVPSVAMAESGTVLYSDSFNGYPISEKTAEGTVFAVQSGTQYSSVKDNADWQWIFNSPASRTLDKKITVGFDGGEGDDTAAIMINEKEADDKYLSMPQNRFSGRCKPQISGLDQYSANADESLVISFKAMLTAGDQGAATLDLGDLGTITSDTLGTGEWKDVKLVVADGTTTKYVAGAAVGEPVSAVPSVIKPVPFDAATKCTTYATVCIDELVILSSADGVDAVIPAAADQELKEEDPVETATPEAAPAFAAHATAQKLMSQTFNAVDTGSLISIGIEAQEPNTSVPGLEFRVGNRKDGADASSYASVSKLSDDNNTLKIAGGKFASNGRGVRMALADNLSIADDTSLTSIMAFAFKVEPLQDGGKGQLYLLDNDTNVDGNDVARDILAVFTSADDAENYKNGDTQIGINVTAGEWHKARIAVSNGSYRVYLDDDTENPAVKAEKVNSGSTSKAVTNLPILVATNAKSGSENYSLVTIDNIMAYQISSTFEKKYLPSVAETQKDVVPDQSGATPDPDATTAPTASPKPAKAAAPKLTAHSSATKLTEVNFNSYETGKGVVMGTNVQNDYKEIEGLSLSVGGREGDVVTKAVVAENIKGDNVLYVESGKFAGTSRSPKVAMADNLSIAEDTSLTSIMGFAFRIAPATAEGKAQLFLINNPENQDGQYVPREKLAVFTAEGDADSYKNGDTKIGVDVTANEWHTAVIAVSGDNYRLYLDGDYDNAVVKASKTGQGSTTYPVQNLPILTTTNSQNTNYSKAEIDNIVAYQISASFEKKYLPTVSEANTYTVFDVTYDGGGLLKSVSIDVVIDPTSLDPVLEGTSRKYIWNTKTMVPYVKVD